MASDFLDRSQGLRGRNVEHVITSNERVAISIGDHTIDVFFRLFQCDVHITIQTRQHTTVIYTRGQANDDALSNDAF